MRCVSQIEIDSNARTILDRHWPDVPLLGDIRDVSGDDIGDIDVLVGGFPCQDVSIANTTRRGLAGDRSGMFFQFIRLVEEYARIIDDTQPRWVVLENVGGLLTSGRKPKPGIANPDPENKKHWVPDRGADFETVVRTLAELGYVGSWRLVNTRLVDSTYGGVPQQRERVLLVGHRGEHPGARAVLADAEGGGSDSPLDHQGRGLEARGPEAAPSAVAHRAGDQSGRRAGAPGDDRRAGDGGHHGRGPVGRAAPSGDIRLTFRKSRRAQSPRDFSTWVDDGRSNTLNTFDTGIARTTHIVIDGDRARILTPREWERLSGYPDDWTEGLSDSVRWGLLGNTITPNLTHWLGDRLTSIPLLAVA